MGGDLKRTFLSRISFRFQSTSPHGGRRYFNPFPLPLARFNPRPRMGGDLGHVNAAPVLVEFQSTRPRMGGDFSMPDNV